MQITMYNFPRKWLLVILFFSLCNTLKAQTLGTSNHNSERENNPYSKYGIGELWNGNSTAIKAMSNITSAYNDPFIINADNPASYSSLVLTTFEGGAIASRRTITNATGASYTTSTASLGYLCLGLPINKNAGLSFGLRPYSKTYYALVDTSITPVGQTMRSYAGDGGLSYAYLGAAYKFKGLSIGFNFGYLFGNYRNFTTVNGIDSLAINRAYEAQFAKYNRLGGIYWKGGFNYTHKFSDSQYVFTLGGTLSLGQNIKETVSSYRISIYNFGDTLVNDTNRAYSYADRTGKLKLPVSYSIGVMMSKNEKWGLGIDYTATNWAGYNSSPDSSWNYGIASQTYKLAIGGQFTPNSADLNNYFSRVTLRAGLYYGTDYVRLQNTTMSCYGFTLGGSFPYKRNVRTFSRLQASIDIGRMGTTANNLLQQSYVRFGLGLTFNEKWFIPRKYE